jgi:hypothetical protein
MNVPGWSGGADRDPAHPAVCDVVADAQASVAQTRRRMLAPDEAQAWPTFSGGRREARCRSAKRVALARVGGSPG